MIGEKIHLQLTNELFTHCVVLSFGSPIELVEVSLAVVVSGSSVLAAISSASEELWSARICWATALRSSRESSAPLIYWKSASVRVAISVLVVVEAEVASMAEQAVITEQVI